MQKLISFLFLYGLMIWLVAFVITTIDSAITQSEDSEIMIERLLFIQDREIAAFRTPFNQ